MKYFCSKVCFSIFLQMKIIALSVHWQLFCSICNSFCLLFTEKLLLFKTLSLLLKWTFYFWYCSIKLLCLLGFLFCTWNKAFLHFICTCQSYSFIIEAKSEIDIKIINTNLLHALRPAPVILSMYRGNTQLCNMS